MSTAENQARPAGTWAVDPLPSTLRYLVGFENRLLVLLRRIWSFLTRRRGARVCFSGSDGRPSATPTGDGRRR
jgi:hypothetical protein